MLPKLTSPVNSFCLFEETVHPSINRPSDCIAFSFILYRVFFFFLVPQRTTIIEEMTDRNLN